MTDWPGSPVQSAWPGARKDAGAGWPGAPVKAASPAPKATAQPGAAVSAAPDPWSGKQLVADFKGGTKQRAHENLQSLRDRRAAPKEKMTPDNFGRVLGEEIVGTVGDIGSGFGVAISPIGAVGDMIGKRIDPVYGKPGSSIQDPDHKGKYLGGDPYRKYGDLAEMITPAPPVGKIAKGVKALATGAKELATGGRAAKIAAEAERMRPPGEPIPAKAKVSPTEKWPGEPVAVQKPERLQKALAAKTDAEPTEMLAPKKATPFRDMAKGVKALASPATVDDDARAAAQLHRSILGKRGIESDKAAYDLGVHQRLVGNASPEDQLALIRYVESRSTGDVPLKPQFQKSADAIRKVAQDYRKQIEYTLGEDGPSFVQDYYARMWMNKPEDVERAIGGKQGSGRSLKARSLPTYEDGLKAGLTPRYANPLDAMSAYADNMGKFLATQEILTGMQGSEIGAKFFTPGQQPEGWVPLDGVQTSKPGIVRVTDGSTTGRSPAQTMYAPEGAARVYNNYISKGLESKRDIGPIYRGARAAVNGLVQIKLGLSAFHASVMGQEGIVSEFAKGLKQVSRGDVKGLGSIASSPAAPVRTALRGGQMKREILGLEAPSEFNTKLNSIYEKTGARLGMDKIYATRKGTSMLSSALRGTLKRDLADAMKQTYTGSAFERARGVTDLAGNIIQSTAAPIFEHYIPNMKRGAWAQQMGDWLKANPGATEAEQTRYGQQLLDNIDNRFGELVVNNNFWNRTGFQIAQVLALSPSWDIGTVREIGGGIAQIPKSLKGLLTGKGITDKTAYIAALVGVTMAQNALATYMHTGEMPEGEDFFAYRTGGTDAATGKPERAIVPGYMKDVLSWALEGPGKTIANKMNPGLKSAAELLSNKDFKQQPIRDENASPMAQAGQVAGYAAEQALPISVGSSSRPEKGTQLTGVERMMGIRPAPRYLTDIAGSKAGASKRARQDWKKKQRTDAKMKSRQADQ